MSRTSKTDIFVRVTVAILAVIMIAPIAVVVILSFSGDKYLTFPPNSVSLQWYEAFLGNPGWRSAMMASLITGLLTSLISTSIGFLAAYALVRGRILRRRMLLSLILLPMIAPHVITAIALYYVSVSLGLVGSRLWLALGHSVIATPIVVLILMSTLQGVNINLERAAVGLGASRVVVFRRIVLPLIFPGITSAALFSFLTSFDELIIALFLSGVSSATLPVRIWNSLRMEVEPTIAAVSAFLIAATTLVLLIDALTRRILGARNAA